LDELEKEASGLADSGKHDRISAYENYKAKRDQAVTIIRDTRKRKK
jgi:hypothetical protein